MNINYNPYWITLQELGVDTYVEPEMKYAQTELDMTYEELCAGCQWDMHGDGDQREMFHTASVSTCELGFEKVSCVRKSKYYARHTCI